MKSIRNSPSKTKKKLLISLLVVVFALILYLLSAYAYKFWPFSASTTLRTEEGTNVVNYDAPTEEQTNAGTEIKEKLATNTTNEDNSSNSNTIPVTISSVQPGETVYIRALIGKVTSTATCKLNMSGPEGRNYTATVPVQAMASTSTCQGFNIPMSALTAGDWKITILVSDGSSSGEVSTEKKL